MEHLNRVVKESIKGLGANKTGPAITRIGKALGTIVPVLSNFDRDNGVAHLSGAHQVASTKKDMETIIKELDKAKVFSEINGRSHSSFKNPVDHLHRKPIEELHTWISDHVKNISY